jgi:hypothetical protein
LAVVAAAIGIAALFSSAAHATVPYVIQLDKSTYTTFPGGSVDVHVTVVPNGGFNSNLHLCAKSADGTSTFGQITGDLQITAGDWGPHTLTVSPSDNLSPHDIAMSVADCDSATPAFIAPFTLHLVPAPNYSVNVSPGGGAVIQGQSKTFNVAVIPSGGFNSSVSMCLLGNDGGTPTADLPTGISLENGPVAYSFGSYFHQLTVDTTTDVVPDVYSLFFGSCDTTHYSDLISVDVVPPNFHFDLQDNNISTFNSVDVHATASLTGDPGFSGTIDLAPSGWPSGFHAGLWPSINVPSVTMSEQLPFTIDDTVPSGDYSLDVVASAEGTSLDDQTMQINVHVIQPSADGTGTLEADRQAVLGGSTGDVLFDYTVVGGGLHNGAVTIDVPTGWSAPSIASSDPGYVTANQGVVSVNNRTITVSGLTMYEGDDLQIAYGADLGATAPSVFGSQLWDAKEKSTASGTLAEIAGAYIYVSPAPGLGTATISPTDSVVGSNGNTLMVTYTAGAGGLDGGTVGFSVPDGWSDPSTDSSEPGYVSSLAGTPSVDGRFVYLSGVNLGPGDQLTFLYGDAAGGGATAPSDGGAQEWTVSETPNTYYDPTDLATSPSVAVVSPDGSGTLTSDPMHEGIGSTGNSITFEYTPGSGGMVGGAVTLTVPTGWTAPATADGAGHVSADSGTVSVASRTITVSGVTLGESDTLHITYENATAPNTGGFQTWNAQQKSTSGGTLTDLGDSPQIELLAADGSGTMTVDPTFAIQGSSDQTQTFTYTVANGGMDNGVVTLQVPDDWDLAQIDRETDPGYVTADNGDLSLDGQTIIVSSLTMAAGDKLTITYNHANVPATGEVETWDAAQQSAADGFPQSLAASPTVSIVSADGSGDVTVDPSQVGKATSHNTLDFTYTADTGGAINGVVTIQVPTGWSAPSTKKTDPGFTTSSDGTVSVSGMTITVSALNLGDGDNVDINYGDQSQGGSGAKSPTAFGDTLFHVFEKSVAGGTLTELASSPLTVTVIPPPTVTNLIDTSTSSLTGLVGDPVTITGTNFDTATDVKFNGTSVGDFTIDDPNTIETTVPDGATTGKVTVVNGGGSAVSTKIFTVILPPEVDSFTPDGGKVGTVVTINGHFFTGADDPVNGEIDFNGTPATTFKVLSDTKITATVPAGATSGPITVQNAADVGTSGDDFSVVQPPTIDANGVDPLIGGYGFEVTITGSGFDTGPDPKLKDVVKFNGKAATVVNVQDDNTIVANVPTGATTGFVTVTNQAGMSTSDAKFVVVLPPKITSFSPAFGVAPGAIVTVKGSNLTGVDEVDFNGDPDVIVADFGTVSINSTGTQLTVQVPENAITGPITLINAGGQVSSKSFGVETTPEFTDPGDQFSVDSAKVGAPVKLFGSGFIGTKSVVFNGSGTPVTQPKFTINGDGTLITTTVPVGATSGTITLTNDVDSVESDDTLSVIVKPLNVSFTQPLGGNEVGDDVTLHGTGFTGTTSVKIGGAAAEFLVVSDTEISTGVPLSAKTGKVSVTNPAGVATSAATFTVIPPPTIKLITPLMQVANGTATITIAGANFGADLTHIDEIDVGDANDGKDFVTSFTPTSITLTVPDDASSGYVYVFTTDHGYAVSPKPFVLIEFPNIDHLSVTHGKVGTKVTIFGDHFFGTTSVTFGGGFAAVFKVSADGTSITTSVPAKSVTGLITVTNAAGSSTSGFSVP